MVGSRNYFDKTVDGNFNVSTASRQPGSSFKPIVYAAAFEKGYTANTTLFDVRTEFNASCSPTSSPLPGQKGADCYSPSNYDDAFRGPLTLKQALAQSINVVAVKLLYLVGIKDSLKMAADLGITTLNDPNRYGLSLVIGGGETTLLEMTSAYGVFATSGIRHPHKGIMSIEDENGKVLETFEDNPYEVLRPNTTNILSDILSDDSARTPTFGANSILNIPGREVAVKTGTTNNNKDAWTIGYTPSVAVGVWVGNNDNKPMKKGGAALAGPIWNAVMAEALKDKPIEFFEKPEPIDQSLPPILRGFWQGGETMIGQPTQYDTTTGMPIGNSNETSITNVHTILYWINKNDPLNRTPYKRTDDLQYNNWEYGVQKWWANNFMNYKITTGTPQTPDVNQNKENPVFSITGIKSTPYENKESVAFLINSFGSNTIKKIDIYINNTYFKSLKTPPFLVSFIPEDVEGIGSINTIKIVGYDTSGMGGEATANFEVIN
jgi:membrane peptidoglycan carboxypeptidase